MIIITSLPQNEREDALKNVDLNEDDAEEKKKRRKEELMAKEREERFNRLQAHKVCCLLFFTFC